MRPMSGDAREPGDALPALGPRGEGWVALQVVLLGAVFGGLWWGGAWDGALRVALNSVGGALATAGVVLGLAAGLRLGTSLTPMPKPHETARFVGTGVYARARHPIYGAVVLCCVGCALLFASVPSLVASGAVALVLFLKSLREEAWLVERYPEYRAYRAGTKRFVPWVL